MLSREWGDGYGFSCGGIHIHETIDHALVREFEEETGIKVRRDKIITCELNFYYYIGDKQYWNNIQVYYTVKKTGGKFGNNKPDEQEKKRGQVSNRLA